MAMLKKLFIDRRELLPLAKDELEHRGHVFGKFKRRFEKYGDRIIELRVARCHVCGREAIIKEYPWDCDNGGHYRGDAFNFNCTKAVDGSNAINSVRSFTSMAWSEIRRRNAERQKEISRKFKMDI